MEIPILASETPFMKLIARMKVSFQLLLLLGSIDMEKLIRFFHTNNHPEVQMPILAGVVYRLDRHSTGHIAFSEFESLVSRNNLQALRQSSIQRRE